MADKISVTDKMAETPSHTLPVHDVIKRLETDVVKAMRDHEQAASHQQGLAPIENFEFLKH